MAVQGAQVDVSTTAVALNSADTDGTTGQTLLVRNLDTDDLTLPCSAPPRSGTGSSPPASSPGSRP